MLKETIGGHFINTPRCTNWTLVWYTVLPLVSYNT